MAVRAKREKAELNSVAKALKPRTSEGGFTGYEGELPSANVEASHLLLQSQGTSCSTSRTGTSETQVSGESLVPRFSSLLLYRGISVRGSLLRRVSRLRRPMLGS